jgi:general secretion pathway protein G
MHSLTARQLAQLSPKQIAKKVSRQQGFTLIEIMIVVVILSILASLIIPRIMNRPDQARVVKAQQDMRALQSALNMYRLDNYHYPNTNQGLQALVTKPSSEPKPANWQQPYLDKLPMDPWGQPYLYLMPGKHSDFDLFTYGADQRKGGADSDADLGHWDLE